MRAHLRSVARSVHAPGARILPLLALPLLSAASNAQEGALLHRVPGAFLGDRVGHSVSGGDDLNGDGRPDLIVGCAERGGAQLPSGTGFVRAIDGVTGAVLWTRFGDGIGDGFGSSVDFIGDVNNDGRSDVVVGAPYDDNVGADSGSARVFSGANGATLYTLNGDSAGDHFGTSVAGAGDLNNDNLPDIAVGIPDDDPNGGASGMARLYSGNNGNLIWWLAGGAPGDSFGLSVDAAGDWDNDGWDDVLIGIPGLDVAGINTGATCVFSGRDASLLITYFGSILGEESGTAVAYVGDVNLDGAEDYVTGSPKGPGGGLARLISSGSGTFLYTWNGGGLSNFGASVAGAGDVNGDTRPDILVGGTVGSVGGQAGGGVRAYSGFNGSQLALLGGYADNQEMGFAVASAGDIDLDGRSDVILGAPGSPEITGAEAGAAYVVSLVEAATVYCTPKINSLGCTPSIASSGTPRIVPSIPFDISASGIINNKNGILFYGFGDKALAFQGGTLCVDPPIKRTPPKSSQGNPPPNDCSGEYHYDFNALIASGSDPALTAGVTVRAQYWSRDPQSSFTVSLTDALRFTIRQ